MKDLASNDKLRKEPLFYGPFKIKKMVQGESIEWVPNTYYSQKPKVKKLTVETVSTSQAAAAVKAGKYDILLNQTPQVYDAVKMKKISFNLANRCFTTVTWALELGLLIKTEIV